MKRGLVLLLFVVCVILVNAQQLAFPGAEGFGRYATGGRTGTVYRVTNLNDSGAGSFRDAVSQPNRIVVFDVGGVINVSSRIVIKRNITIAGQTAPGEGITLYGNGIALNDDSGNNIIQYIRIRMGKNGDSGKDAVGISAGTNYIFNHVSVSWGRDGNVDINGSGIDNITIQDCIISQGINNSNHSTGGLMQSGKFSIIRTLWIDNKTRNPKARGSHEFINSVIYNWGTNGYIMGDTEGASSCNLIGNYFICGPSGSSGDYITNTTPSFQLYASDNWLDGNKNGLLDGTLLSATEGGYKTATIMPAPFNHPGVGTVLPAAEAVGHITQHAGASLSRDEVDKYLIDQLTSFGTKGAIINTEDDNGISGGAGIVFNGTKPVDSDNDGMPDSWEDANGTNKTVDDAMVIAANGYANIENYVHSIKAPFPFLKYPINVSCSEKSTSTLSLKWENREEQATEILIEYGKSGAGFTNSKKLAGLATSAIIDGLESNTSYSFRFIARNGSTESAWSSVFTFTTNAEATAPKPSENPSPANGSTIGAYRFIQLMWNNPTSSMAGTLYYDVFLGKSEDQMEKVATQITSKTFTTGDLEQTTKYFWRVKTTNTMGADEGTIWSFTTGQAIQREKILYFPFDETSGTAALEMKSGQQAIAVNFSPQWSAGKKANSINYPGAPANAHLKLAHNPSLFLDNQSFTISLWFKSPGGIADSYLFHKGMHDKTNNGTGKWIGIQYKGTTLTFAIDDDVTKTNVDISGANKWFNNAWHHLVCVRDIASDKLIVYVDGVKVGEKTDGTNGIGETGDLIIGNRNGYFDNPFIGWMDELTLFGVSLTDDEIKDIYLSTGTLKLDFAFNQFGLKLFPNPFDETLTIDVSGCGFVPDKIRLINSQGSEVYTASCRGETGLYTLQNLSHLPKGIFYCVVSSETNRVVGKAIKR